jgi:hypothetical protein
MPKAVVECTQIHKRQGVFEAQFAEGKKGLTGYLHSAKVALGYSNSYMELSFIYETIKKCKF